LAIVTIVRAVSEVIPAIQGLNSSEVPPRFYGWGGNYPPGF